MSTKRKTRLEQVQENEISEAKTSRNPMEI